MSLSQDQQSEMLATKFVFTVCPSRGLPKYITTKAVWKIKRGLEPLSLFHFLPDFCRKNSLTLYFFNWPNFIAWLSFIIETLGYICIVTISCPVCDVINFEINLRYLIELSFYITKKSRQKFKYLNNEKSF